MDSTSKPWLFLGAIFCPALFSAVTIQVIKLLEPPISSGYWQISGMLFGVIIGTVCLSLLPIRRRSIKYFSIAVYVPLMLWVSWLAASISFFINWEYCC